MSKMKAHRELGKLALKLGIGAGLIVYVLHSKMIDFDLVHSLLLNPINLWIALAFLFFSLLCCGTRWYLLVRAQGLALSFRSLLELTMIGMFFNTFMPGSVGGDLIKAWYVAGHEPQRKTKAVFTVLLDRAIGLAVIVFYSAVTLLFYRHWIGEHPQLHLVALSIWAFSGACLFFGAIFYLPGVWEGIGVPKLMVRLRSFPALYRVCDAAVHYQHHLPTIFLSVVLSAFSVLGINLMYQLEGAALGLHLSTAQYFFIVPLALTVTAVPVLPGGLGVGQVAFFTLFAWTGAANPQQGATLATVMQAYTILFNCLGAVFYLKYKRKPRSLSEPETEEVSVSPGPLGSLL